ncbi:MAG: hypothetical protein HKP55_02705 [Gammaproteobacteria bacterium]|nr:hypothetical protein [Gammaproteobacteria bacterium]
MQHIENNPASKPAIKTATYLFLSIFFLPMVALAEAAPASAKTPATNSLTQALGHWGVKNCSERMNQLSGFVGYNKSSAAMALMPPSQVNQRMLPIAMEIPTENGAAYVSANFAPNQANHCGASYDAVVYWEQGCADIAENRFKAYKNIGALGNEMTVLDGGIATKVFLMPAGSGCVSIKKEVVL